MRQDVVPPRSWEMLARITAGLLQPTTPRAQGGHGEAHAFEA